MSATLNKKSFAIILGGAALLLLAVLALYLNSRPDVPKFSDYPAGSERKDAFFGYFLPLVEQRNAEILQTRAELQELQSKADSLSSREERQVIELASRYRIEEFDPVNAAHWDLLMRRVDVVPPSLALAQAANESAWGTSRFSLEGYNYFGQWCFTKGCGLVPESRDSGKTHEVADFGSPQESVEAYMRNLNRHAAYKDLRLIREDLRESDNPITGVDLAAGLVRYSERGDEYIHELRSMIRYNELDELDL